MNHESEALPLRHYKLNINLMLVLILPLIIISVISPSSDPNFSPVSCKICMYGCGLICRIWRYYSRDLSVDVMGRVSSGCFR